VAHVTKGGQQPAGCFTPPATAGYTCKASIPYDPAAARRLLAEAGYPGGRGFPSVELLYNTSESHKTIAEAVQQMWKKNLGVNVTLVNQDWKVYLDTVERLDYRMARGSWIGDYVDPSTFLECWTTDNGNTRTGYSSAEYDALIARAARTAGASERNALFEAAEEILLRDAPLAPVYFYTRVYLKAPELQGWRPNLLGRVFYKCLYLAEPQPKP
jgi:oligopeptide transport system substrate-binding protein